MNITADQMSALAAHAPRNFSHRLHIYFNAQFAGRAAHSGDTIPGGAKLERTINEYVEKAMSFGISNELGVGQFVALGLGYSNEFYEIPRVNAMLTDEEFTPDENIQRVINVVIVAEARGV